jgi:peptidyl-prolyl cis-trans isomerase C
MLKPSNIAALALLAAIAANTVNAADNVVNKANTNTLATVNNIAIPQARFDHFVKTLVQQGQLQADQPLTVEQSKKIRDQLIDLEVLAQAAHNQGLDSQADNAQILELNRQNILSNMYIQDYYKNHSVTEADVKQAYENAKAKSAGVNQFKIAHIIVANEKDIKAVAASLKNKAKFEKVAQEKSLDTRTKNSGGVIGWFFSTDLPPALAEAILKLSKGQVSAPIKSQNGWSIFKLEDIRDFPPYDEIKGNIQMGLQNKAIQDAVKKLRADAKVE